MEFLKNEIIEEEILISEDEDEQIYHFEIGEGVSSQIDTRSLILTCDQVCPLKLIEFSLSFRNEWWHSEKNEDRLRHL